MFNGHKEASRVIWGYITVIGVLLLAFIGYLIFKPSFDKKLIGTWKLYEIKVGEATESIEYIHQYTFYNDNTASLTKLDENNKEVSYNYDYKLDNKILKLTCIENEDLDNEANCEDVEFSISFKGNKLILDDQKIKEYYLKSNGY